MSMQDRTIEAGGVRPPATVNGTGPTGSGTVRVWAPFVRVFHWSLVGLFVLAFATGDELERLHIAAGYAVAALVLARIAWGFVGPKRARFGDFVRPPREVLAYLGQAIRLRAPRH